MEGHSGLGLQGPNLHPNRIDRVNFDQRNQATIGSTGNSMDNMQRRQQPVSTPTQPKLGKQRPAKAKFNKNAPHEKQRGPAMPTIAEVPLVPDQLTEDEKKHYSTRELQADAKPQFIYSPWLEVKDQEVGDAEQREIQAFLALHGLQAFQHPLERLRRHLLIQSGQSLSLEYLRRYNNQQIVNLFCREDLSQAQPPSVDQIHRFINALEGQQAHQIRSESHSS